MICVSRGRSRDRWRRIAMPLRSVGKWVCVGFIAWTSGSAVAACGGTGNGSVFTDGGGGGGDSSGGVGDATTGDDGPTLVSGDGGDGSSCTVKTWAQLGFDCGQALQCNNTVITNCNPTDAANEGCPAGQACVNNSCGTGGPVEGGLG